MEIVIGREEGQRRLKCTVNGGKSFFVGNPNSVPLSVSRQHCKIIVEGSNISVENLKAANITFVDGNQVFKKAITANSQLQLGNEKYAVPLQRILSAIQAPQRPNAGAGQQGAQGPIYSLAPLEAVWKEYEERRLAIQEEAARSANMSRIQGILSMSAMLIGFVPVIPQELRVAIIVLALGVACYFFYRGMAKDSVHKQLNSLEKEFQARYKCPNPACEKPFGNAAYVNIKFMASCPVCKCRYSR